MRRGSFIGNLQTKYNTTKYVLKLTPNARVFWRFVKGYIKVNYFNKEQIRFVEIFVTLACNAKCEFCSNGLFTNKKGNISTEKYLSLIDECADLNVPVICLIGGEPLLYKNLGKLIRRIDRHGISSMIATNGYMLTEKKVKELSKAGLTNISVSLLSPDPKKHDAMYKLPGSYDRIFKARKYCKKYGILFSLATVVYRDDFSNGNFEKYVRLATKLKIPLSINPIIPTGYAKDLKDQLLTKENIYRLDKVSQENVYVSTHLTNNLFGFGCPAGNSYVGINATGEMFPCFFIPISLGNVKDTTIRQAWQKSLRSKLFTKRHKMCYAGVSREFICKYMDPVYQQKIIPMPIEKHPMYKKNGLMDLKVHNPEEAASLDLPADIQMSKSKQMP